MKNRGIRILCTSLVLIVLLGCTMPAMAAEYVYVLGNTTVRSTASATGTRLGGLNAGDSVQKLGVSGSWTSISYNGKTGYVQSKDVADHAAKEEARAVKALKSGNIRNGPGTNYQKVGSLKKGGTVAYIKTEGEWARIEYNGKTAYILASFLDLGSVVDSVSGGASCTVTFGKGDMELKLYVSKTVLSKGEAIGKGFGTATFTYKGSKKSVKLFGDDAVLTSIKTKQYTFGGISKLDINNYTLNKGQSLTTGVPPTSGYYELSEGDNSPYSKLFKFNEKTGELLLAPGQYTIVASVTYDTNEKFNAPVTLKVEIPISVLAA